MLGLLDNVFQRLGTMSASVGGQGFNNPNNAAAQYNNNAYNNNGAPGNPYNYYNGNAPGTQPGGQPAASYGGQQEASRAVTREDSLVVLPQAPCSSVHKTSVC